MAEHRGEISIYPSDVGVQFEWSIKNVFSLSEKDGKAYQSPDFHYNGQTWILRFYPNGWSGRDSYRHIDVGLVRESFGPPARLAYSLSIKTVKGNKDNEEHREKIFSDDIDLDDDILRRFLLRSELLRRRSELLPDGILTFICTMKNRTSPGSASKSLDA